MKIHQALLQMCDRRDSENHGICYNFLCAYPDREDYTSDQLFEWLKSQFRVWPEFSGDIDYPVLHNFWDATMGYAAACRTRTLWDKSTEYGKARYRLLDFLIKRAEEQMV